MANNINQTKTKLILANEVNTVSIINYLWYDKPYDVLLVSNQTEINFDFPKDGVYEVYQITLSPTSIYQIVDNQLQLKADGSVILIFGSGLYDKEKLEKFIKDESGKAVKAICYTNIDNSLSELATHLLDLKIKGCCDLSKNLVEQRDILRMAVIALKYFAGIPATREAQRIIESISLSTCSNLKNNFNNCGCK